MDILFNFKIHNNNSKLGVGGKINKTNIVEFLIFGVT
jgi:hypothetical protein